MEMLGYTIPADYETPQLGGMETFLIHFPIDLEVQRLPRFGGKGECLMMTMIRPDKKRRVLRIVQFGTLWLLINGNTYI